MTRFKHGISFVLAVLIGLYSLTLVWAYGDDKERCLQHGYTSNTITPTLDGYCEKPVADGVVESVAVDKLSVYDNRRYKSTQLAQCVLSRKDPENC